MTEGTASRLNVKHPEKSLQFHLEEQVGVSPAQSHAALEIFLDWSRTVFSDCRPGGQIVCTVVAADEPAGKPVKDCRRINVHVTVNHQGDAEIQHRHGTVALRRLRLFRVCWEAREQGGAMSHEDLSVLFALDRSTVGRIIADLNEQGFCAPTRGAMHDMGRSPSHKQQIARLLCRGYVYTAVTALTGHTEKSIERYALQMGRVVALADAGAAENDIRIICDLSEEAARIYLGLYHEHNTAEFRPHLDKLKRRYEASNGVKGSGYPKPTRKSPDPMQRIRESDFARAVSLQLQMDLRLTQTVADHVASRIAESADSAFCDTQTLKPGQTVVLVDSAESAPKTSGQPAAIRPLVPVVLSVFTDDKLAIWCSDASMREKRALVADAIAREAQEQGGTMTVAMLGLFLGLGPAVMAEALAYLRKTQEQPTPIKGITEDAGATLTHKEVICDLEDEGYTPPEISRVALHAPESRDRYLKTNLRVETLIKVLQGIPDEVRAARFLGQERSVVRQYLDRHRRKQNAQTQAEQKQAEQVTPPKTRPS